MMNKNKHINLLQDSLRAGVCLFMLSGSCMVSAHNLSGIDNVQSIASETTKVKSDAKKDLKVVTGFVYDAATREPLAGVRVQALNNRYYTALTDDKGAYSIKVPKFVNSLYISVPDYNAVQIALKSDKDQNAFLYTTDLKGLYSDGTDMNLKHEMNLSNSSALTIENDIENKMNGAVRTISRGGLPAQGAAMFINGLNSLNTNAQPLIIVDGVMWDMQYDRGTLHDGFVNNVFNLIDTEDIENVEVIKNGTALYGAKGANGVILIKTKRGKSMVTRINIRAFGGFELVPDKLDVMNADQYRNYVTELIGTTPRAQDYFKNPSNPLPSFMNEDKGYLFYDVYHNNTDWQKDLYKNAFTQNYKVSVEGGDDVAKYNLSLGYTQSNATADANDFNRLNIRFNTDIVLFKNLTTELDISYVKNAYNLRDNGWAADYSQRNISSPNVLGAIQSPFISPYHHFVYYENGLHLGHTDKMFSGQNYHDANNPFAFASQFGYEGFVNPFWIIENGDGDNKNYQEQTQFAINVAPKYQINKYLSLTNRFSYLLNRNNEKYYLPNDGTPSKEVEGLGFVRSIVRSQFGKETTLFNDLQLNWARQFNKNYVNVLAGFRMSSYSYGDSFVGGYNNDNDKMPNMSNSLQFKSYGGSNDSWINLGYYLSADYNYRNKYFLTGTTTMESSSRFGNDTKEGIKMFGVKWGLFPSLQAAWLISSENWFKVKPIDYLKLTAGYEESGNDNVDYYAVRTYFENSVYLDKATGLKLANIQNPSIQWETNHRFNVGLQTGLLNNRLHLGLEYFWSKTTNLLTRKAVSDITGLSTMWTNDGALENKGVELTAHAVLLNKRNWKWQAGFSLGHYKNEITELPVSSLNEIKTYALKEDGTKGDAMPVIHGYTSSIYGNNNILTAVGRPAGVFYGFQTAGVFKSESEAASASDKYGYLRYPTGFVASQNSEADASRHYRKFHAGDVHFVDQNGDGWISDADMVEIGDPNPDIFGNLYTSLTWKNLTLDLNFKYSLGNDVFNYQRSQLESANNIYNQTTAVVNRWKSDGQFTDVPRLMSVQNDEWVNNERFSDRWIEDGSYLKLKKARLTYKLPINLSWLLGMTVWGEANNVFTITKYLGNDPEFSCGNGVLYQGIDAGYLPTSRNFNIGVTINL